MCSHWTERWQELQNIIKDFFKALPELHDEEVLEVKKLTDDKSHSLELLLGTIVASLVKEMECIDDADSTADLLDFQIVLFYQADNLALDLFFCEVVRWGTWSWV